MEHFLQKNFSRRAKAVLWGQYFLQSRTFTEEYYWSRTCSAWNIYLKHFQDLGSGGRQRLFRCVFLHQVHIYLTHLWNIVDNYKIRRFFWSAIAGKLLKKGSSCLLWLKLSETFFWSMPKKLRFTFEKPRVFCL